MIKVVHCRKEKYDIYIGHAIPLRGIKGSKWCNPFEVGRDGTREQVIAKYRDWITRGGGRHLVKDLHELRDKVIGCWCKPKACHGDVLKQLIDG